MVDEETGSKAKEEEIVMKSNSLDIASPNLQVNLPCGYVDTEEILHEDCIVREMTGQEEDLLTGRGSVVNRLNAIISNCIVKLGTISDKQIIDKAVNKLTGQDRMAILIGIRRASLGDFYDMTVTCPSCKAEQHMSVNLADIDIIPMPDRFKREHETTLPSGKVVKWHVLDTADEEWLSSKKRKYKEDVMSLNFLSRVDVVDKQVIERERKYKHSLQVFKKLSLRDRNYLRDVFDKNEGDVDRTVEFECESCGRTWEGEIEVSQSNFFFPSVS